MKQQVVSISSISPKAFQQVLGQLKSISFVVLSLWVGSSLSSLWVPKVASAKPVFIQSSPQSASFAIAQANILYVNPVRGSDSAGAGDSDRNPLRTISFALRQAQPGTVIQLMPGNYTKNTGESFPLVIKPGVTLQGNESTKGQGIMIIGGDTYVSPTFARQSITILAENNSEIRGVTITNPSTRGTGIWVESTNPMIANNTLVSSLRDGIFVTGTGNPKIEGNVFSENDGNGLAIARNASGEIRGNVFRQTGFGITIGDNAAPLLIDNQISENTDGIVVSNAARPVLRGNRVELNVRDGVVAIADALPDLGTTDQPGNNFIRNNGRHDIYNATRTNILPVVGNNVDPQRISGKVNFVASDVQPGGSLRDIQGHWAQAYIETLAKQQIVSGFPDGTFRPDAPVTRVEFAALVTKAFQSPPRRPASSFKDVSTSFWGYQVITSAQRSGFVSGYPDQSFRPSQNIPRLEVLLALASGLNLTAQNPGVVAFYNDAAQIPPWAVSAIAATTERSVVVNYPTVNQLNPQRNATRAEVAAFIYQALASVGKVEPIPSAYVVKTP